MTRSRGAVRLAVSVTLTIAAACEAGHPSARGAGESASTTSSSPLVAVVESTRTASLPAANAVQTGCAAISELLRSAATAGGNRSTAITPPRDTTDQLANPPETGCVVAWRDSTARGLPLQEVYARMDRAGWHRREQVVYGSGPGSGALAFSRDGALCTVNGESDVGDDADSTYVPAPGFNITVACFRDRPDPI
jgi:hypothetical protein